MPTYIDYDDYEEYEEEFVEKPRNSKPIQKQLEHIEAHKEWVKGEKKQQRDRIKKRRKSEKQRKT